MLFVTAEAPTALRLYVTGLTAKDKENSRALAISRNTSVFTGMLDPVPDVWIFIASLTAGHPFCHVYS